MSFDRSKTKRQRLDPSYQHHVAYDQEVPFHPAQPSRSEQSRPASWAFISTNVNVDIPVSQFAGSTTAIECSVAIKVNGQPYDSVLHSTSHVAINHHYQCVQDSIRALDSINLPNGDGQISTVKTETNDETEVCYGMISAISASLPTTAAEGLPTSSLTAHLLSSTTFSIGDRQQIQGGIDATSSSLVQALLEEPAISLEARCSISSRAVAPTKSQPRGRARIPCTIAITIYGPNGLFEDIGQFFEDHNLCLEDPIGCDRNVLYRNPHLMSCNNVCDCLFTSELDKNLTAELLDLPAPKDFLEDFNNNEELAEAEQPIGLKTRLGRHQRQALTFMLRREQGWTFEPNPAEMWEEFSNSRGKFFINNITGSHHSEEPPQCYGGILADPMGLGKTLSIISLVLAGVLSDQNSDRTGPTLIIVPPSLLDPWEEQLSEHVKLDHIKWSRYHGSSRQSSFSGIDSYDIILTTYHTVSAEWRNTFEVGSSPLFSTHWQRVVLDEAHWIRNGNSQMAKAIFSLKSVSRWAVTGTPLQNSLSDLATLLRFLRVAPYCDTNVFDADITRLWKTGNIEEATKRLKRLLCCVLLRRAKSTIQLPGRHDTVCPLDFSYVERLTYDEAKGEALRSVNEALMAEAGAPKGYMNALQRINTLRMLCNLGTHRRSPAGSSRSASPFQDWPALVQQASNILTEFGDLVCHHCGMGIEAARSSTDKSEAHSQPFLASCGRLICAGCRRQFSKHSTALVPCGHTPSCPSAQVETSGSAEKDVFKPEFLSNDTSAPLPTKIAAVVSHLKELEYSVKSVVFSYWTSTLDLVQQGLEKEGISCVRFDGQASLKQRDKAVKAFRTDPSTRVMLLSLSCGAVGLNLTVASRAYLIEPHWNPTLEEQALARIHRLGQTKVVTTVRFYIRDTFEEHVIKIQQSKKDLADLLLVPDKESQGSINTRRLERLRALL